MGGSIKKATFSDSGITVWVASLLPTCPMRRAIEALSLDERSKPWAQVLFLTSSPKLIVCLDPAILRSALKAAVPKQAATKKRAAPDTESAGKRPASKKKAGK